MKRFLGLLAIAALISCSPAKSNTVQVHLTDNMKIVLSQGAATAGPVTFVVTNDGKIVHEMLVLRANDPIPADTDEQGKVSEEASLGETDDMQPGTTKTLTLTLGAGHYTLICNEAGHYEAGMHIGFDVQ